MPELPEVETIRRSLLAVVGQRIEAVDVFEPRLRRPVADDFAQGVTGRVIAAIERRGKYLLFYLEPSRSGAGEWNSPATVEKSPLKRTRHLDWGGDPRVVFRRLRRTVAGEFDSPAGGASLTTEQNRAGDEFILAHLGMTGALLLQPADAPRQLHDHLRFRLSNRVVLTYNDPRRFGLMRLARTGACPELDNVGPDPLSADFSAADLAALARGRKRPVKNLLMDQRALGGIGNIYANEILFSARIRPSRRAHRLTRSELRQLLHATRRVLGAAIRLGGSSISDYRDGSGRPGYFQLHLRVYDRAGQPCVRCHTPVRRAVHAGRSSFYCTRCQR